MNSIDEMINELIIKTRAIIKKEKTLVLESVILIGKLDELRASIFMGLAGDEFAEKVLGLTPGQYWKRISAANVYKRWGDIYQHTKKGRLSVSQVAAMAGKLTEANKDIILKNSLGKTKKETEEFLRRVTHSGEVLDKEEVSRTVTLSLNEEQYQLLQRALEVSASRGQKKRIEEVVEKALDTYLDKSDPLRKAERAEKRKMTKNKSGSEKVLKSITSPREETNTRTLSETKRTNEAPKISIPKERTYIPRDIVYQVWIRDGGQCTHVNHNGERCPSKSMIEVDHQKPLALGGTNHVDNLRLLCRAHNQWSAEVVLGKEFMDRKREMYRPENPK